MLKLIFCYLLWSIQACCYHGIDSLYSIPLIFWLMLTSTSNQMPEIVSVQHHIILPPCFCGLHKVLKNSTRTPQGLHIYSTKSSKSPLGVLKNSTLSTTNPGRSPHGVHISICGLHQDSIRTIPGVWVELTDLLYPTSDGCPLKDNSMLYISTKANFQEDSESCIAIT